MLDGFIPEIGARTGVWGFARNPRFFIALAYYIPGWGLVSYTKI